MRSKLFAGTTSLTAPIYVTNSSAGGGLGSLVFNTSGLVGEYRRAGSSTWTSITLAAGTLGTWSSGGWIADGTPPGAYEVGIPNAALASGEPWVAVRFYGAANMTPVLLYYELDAVNYQSATSFVSSVPTLGTAPFKIDTPNGFSFRMVSSSDNKTAYTGGSVTGSRTIAGGSSNAVTGTITQIGSTSEYYFAGAAGDFNGAEIHFAFVASGANPVYITVNTTP